MSKHTKVFITGVQRSGTTLLATLIDNHPQIYVAPRVRSHRWLTNFNAYERLLLRRPNVDKHTVFNHFFKEETNLSFAKQLAEHPEEPAINLLNRSIDAFLAEQNKHIWLEKAPHLEFQSRDLFFYYPKAKMIHLIRDGRAVAASRYNRKSHDVRATIQEWMQSCGIAAAHQQLIGQENIMVVFYEDLLLKPEQTLANIMDYLGLEYSSDLLSLKGETLQSSDSYVKNNLADDRVKAWQNELSTKQIKQIESIGGKMLHKPGYKLTHPQFETQSKAMSLSKYNRVRIANAFKLIFKKEVQGMNNKKVVTLKRPLRNRLGTFRQLFYRFIFSREIYREKYQPPPKID